MRYEFRFRVRPLDIWQVRMYYSYSSYLAVVNLTCIVSSVALIIATWNTSAPWFKVVMAIFFSLFTVIQPLVIYLSSRAQLKENAPELTLTFTEEGIDIREGGRFEHRLWKEVVSFTVKPTLVIVYTDGSHGYILTNRVLGENRKEFIKDVKSKLVESRGRAAK
ncbi:MAG: YcxB family protein [Lachnospiraceae bacterium]|nr:YcxB family protein [Lachnospiraceae bacterium]